MNIECLNTTCKADNPVEAKYCQKCGAKLKSKSDMILWYSISRYIHKIADVLRTVFRRKTPIKTAYKTFREISMTPTSLIKFKSSSGRAFVVFWVIVIVVIVTIDLMISMVITSLSIILRLFNKYVMWQNNIIDREMHTIWLISIVISFWFLLYNKRKTMQLRLMTDYIVNNSITSSDKDARIIIKHHRFPL